MTCFRRHGDRHIITDYVKRNLIDYLRDNGKAAMKTGESVRSLILKEGLLDEKELDEILEPLHI